MLQSLGELLRCEVALAIVDRLEFAAVDHDELATEQVQLLTKQRERAADLSDRHQVVLAKIGNGLEIGGELFEEPHDLEVAPSFWIQQAAGAQAIEIAIDVELEEVAGMVGRAAKRRGDSTCEAKLVQVKLVDKGVNKPNRIVVCDILAE